MSLLTYILDVSVISGGWEIRLVFDVNDFDLLIFFFFNRNILFDCLFVSGQNDHSLCSQILSLS